MIETSVCSIWNYGRYSSPNYSGHTLAVRFGKITIYFSYETPVAVLAPGYGLVVSQNEFSTTTGKHLNWLDKGKKDRRVPHKKLVEIIEEVAGNTSVWLRFNADDIAGYFENKTNREPTDNELDDLMNICERESDSCIQYVNEMISDIVDRYIDEMGIVGEDID